MTHVCITKIHFSCFGDGFLKGAGLCDYAISITIPSAAEQRKMVDFKIFEEKVKAQIA